MHGPQRRRRCEVRGVRDTEPRCTCAIITSSGTSSIFHRWLYLWHHHARSISIGTYISNRGLCVWHSDVTCTCTRTCTRTCSNDWWLYVRRGDIITSSSSGTSIGDWRLHLRYHNIRTCTGGRGACFRWFHIRRSTGCRVERR